MIILLYVSSALIYLQSPLDNRCTCGNCSDDSESSVSGDSCSCSDCYAEEHSSSTNRTRRGRGTVSSRGASRGRGRGKTRAAMQKNSYRVRIYYIISILHLAVYNMFVKVEYCVCKSGIFCM